MDTGRMSGGPLSPGAPLSWSATKNCLLLVLKLGARTGTGQRHITPDERPRATIAELVLHSAAAALEQARRRCQLSINYHAKTIYYRFAPDTVQDAQPSLLAAHAGRPY